MENTTFSHLDSELQKECFVGISHIELLQKTHLLLQAASIRIIQSLCHANKNV